MAVCLVTGGAGFIGSHLVEALVRLGHDVRVLDNFSTGSFANLRNVIGCVELIPGDVANQAVMRGAADGVEVVFHLAAPVNSPNYQSSGAAGSKPADRDAGTLQVLQCARGAGVRRVVFASTFRVCQYLRSPDACSPYAAAKWAAEQDCVAFTRDLGPESVCLRYFNVFGARQPASSPDWHGIVPILRALHADHRPVIHGSGNELLDVIHVDDVVHATLLAAEAPRVAGRIYDIGRGCGTTMLSIVNAVAAIAGVAMQPVHASNGAAGEPPYLADVSRAEIELGFCPTVNLEQGLRRCLADATTRADEALLEVSYKQSAISN